MSLHIRSAGPDDCAGLHRLIAAHAAFEGGEATITGDALGIVLRASDIRLIIATDQDVLVGYAALTLCRATNRIRIRDNQDQKVFSGR
jgi:hypothetical protein